MAPEGISSIIDLESGFGKRSERELEAIVKVSADAVISTP